METGPPNKPFWMVPFTIHATRGILRDQRTRRAAMGACLVVVLIMVVCGLTLFRAWLDPHEHPVRFILYWLACGWQITLVLLLALLDILVLRIQARDARNALRGEIEKSANESGE